MTFVFTDVVDSTRHLEHLGDANWRDPPPPRRADPRRHRRRGRHRRRPHGRQVLPRLPERGARRRRRGRDPARGDRDLPFEIRIGVHTAEATSLGDNYRGKGVHVAARIGALAGGEEILASSETVTQLTAVEASEPRSEQLKGIADPVDVVAVDWRGAS